MTGGNFGQYITKKKKENKTEKEQNKKQNCYSDSFQFFVQVYWL